MHDTDGLARRNAPIGVAQLQVLSVRGAPEVGWALAGQVDIHPHSRRRAGPLAAAHRKRQRAGGHHREPPRTS